MSVIRKMRKQRAVCWPLSSTDAFGKPVWGSPIAVQCRWEDRTEEALDSKGNKQLSKAVIYPDRDLIIGSMIVLGELSSSTPSDPPATAIQIWRVEKLPNFKATEFLHTVYAT